MSSDAWKEDDEVHVRYKFVGTHRASEIRCTYLQYLNLKMLPNIEYCKIIEPVDPQDKEPGSI